METIQEILLTIINTQHETVVGLCRRGGKEWDRLAMLDISYAAEYHCYFQNVTEEY